MADLFRVVGSGDTAAVVDLFANTPSCLGVIDPDAVDSTGHTVKP